MKKRPAETTSMVINYAILVILAITTLYPFWHVLMYSVSDSRAAMSGGFFLWPRDFSIKAYQLLYRTRMIITSYGNTIQRTVLGTFLNLAFSASLAYPLSLKRFRLRGFLTMMIFFTMLFSGGMIPTFLLVRELRLIDTPWALILPTLVSPFNMFIMRNYFQSLPASLEESASLDGAKPLRILLSIILPLSLPVIAALGLFYGIFHWNAFFDGILYINDPQKQVLQVFLRNIITVTAIGSTTTIEDRALGAGLSEESMKMAAISASIVPIIIVYPWLQKHFVKGVLIGSIKG
ncbi:MAG: carbohydrate ABC transporter permease [Clostridiales bacterium]|mgnify:CR=1 FL=1|nr:carbohydrate ABC transporter permease [Clostridiales bacterium]